jgi:Outer membrane protein beta-barrel domain
MATNTPVVAAAVLAALLTSAASADAQVGVIAGAARSTIAFGASSGSPELTETEWRTALIAGLSLLLPTNRAGGWQVEVLFVEKGAENLLRRDDAMRLTYLEIPVLLHLDVLRRHRNAVFLLAGPSLAFTLRASYEDAGVREDIKDDVSAVDVGLHVGAGVEIGQTFFDARYVWGGRTVFHDGDLDGTFKNRAFTLMAGIRFGR